MSDQRPRVILIEDDSLIRTGQRMLLEDAGYQVAEIATAADLPGFVARSGVAQAIIADFDLGPGMTGIEAALEIVRRSGVPIPTLILSASFGERSLAAAAIHGMPMMFKPMPAEHVLAWVANALADQDVHPEAPERKPP